MKKMMLYLLLTLLTMPLNAEWNALEHFPPMGVVYHPVTTSSKEAQDLFNRGLLATYAFNHDAAYESFQKAVEVDPELAMGYWGMAYAIGENINMKMTEENEKKGFAHIQKALKLVPKASPSEQKYIQALAKRYSNEAHPNYQHLSQQYSDAMRELTKSYPDDLDAAVLFAESLMDLRPWMLWTQDKKPENGTCEIVETLESVLKRDTEHLGANHFYIHAIEGSKQPQKALMSAYRLTNLLPEWGHILHMPSHIFLLVGDYSRAASANVAAIKADEAYIQRHGLGGTYPIHYMGHNIYFFCRSYMFLEQFDKAYGAANKLEKFLTPHIEQMPLLAYYILAPMEVLLYFHRWQELLDLPPAPNELKIVEVYRHFARSQAYASLGKMEEAKKEQELFLKGTKELPKDENMLGYNPAEKIFKVAALTLESTLAKVKGDKATYVSALKKAVDEQDALLYNEPPDWYYPLRQTLGAAYLATDQSALAEKTFRDALELLPRNGRSLFGLLQALKAQRKTESLYPIERELRAALQDAQGTLTLDSL